MQAKEISNLETSYSQFAGRHGTWLETVAKSPELVWLSSFHEDARARAFSLGYPTRRSEDWKYTNVAPLADMDIELAFAETLEAPVLETLNLGRPGLSAELVFINGRLALPYSTLPQVQGLTVRPLRDLLTPGAVDTETVHQRDFIKSRLSQVSDSDATVFSRINDSLLADGVFISVAPEVVIREPVRVVWVSTGLAPEAEKLAASHPRLLVHMGRFAEAALVETFVSAGRGRYLVNSVTDLFVDEGSRLSYCKLQLDDSEAWHIANTRVHQRKDSWTECLSVAVGAGLSRQDLSVHLSEPGAESQVDGLYLTRDKQHSDHHTLIDHAVGQTVSRQLYKGILDDESRGVFNGKILIRQGAMKADSAQLNNNLILSRKAEVDTKPELEIYADDVKAAHGATIGQLNEEELFYFQSRAIGREQAVQMLAHGFAAEVLYRFRNEAIRSHAFEALKTRLADLNVREGAR